MTLNETLLKAALDAAEQGWPVFPLRPDGKRPALHGQSRCPGTGPCAAGHLKWEQRATTDPDRIRVCWRQAPYNVGIATGPAGLVVVDLDQSKGEEGMPDGMTAFTALCERKGQPAPVTYRVRTGSGGRHLYFTAPAGIRLGNTAGTLGSHVDTRAWGGYVVGTGSVVNGQPYLRLNLMETVPLPDWLRTALTPPPVPLRPSQPRPARRPAGARSGYVEAAFANEVANVASAAEGGRREALFRAARALGRFVASGDLPRSAVEDALEGGAQTAGLQPREYWATITQALDWSIRNNPSTAA